MGGSGATGVEASPPPALRLAAPVRVRPGGANGGGGQRTLCFRSKFEHGRYAAGLRGPSSASFGRYEVGRREGWGGRGVYISPVREKKHCGRRSEFAMSAFMPDAAVARQTAQRALRFGLLTVDPPLHSLGSARDRSRRGWRSACAMRVNCSAPGCSEGTPGHFKTTQRRESDALGRQTCARAGTRGVDRFSKTATTRRCAVWGCCWGPWARYLAGAQTRLPQRSRGSARQRASSLAVKVR